MDEAIVIILLIGFALFCFYLWAYNSGEKSVKTDLPKREEEFQKRKASFLEENKLFEEKQKSQSLDLARRTVALNRRERELKKVNAELIRREHELNERERQVTAKQGFLDESRKEVLSSSAWLAKTYADLDAQKARWAEERLASKNHPAFTAAVKVKEFGQLRRQAVLSAKTAQYQLDYFLSLFPWLEDYLEMRPEDAAQLLTEAPAPDNEYASVNEWLSPDEYESLSDAEKWQRALDRYNKRQKSKWQIGIEYERYIGYLLEQKGYTVHYNGATEGVEDMGRDLIAENDTNCLIVQCKRWAQEKVIHEKHIFQLYGTTVLQKLHPKTLKNIIGVFVTTADVSALALDCADYLDIKVYAQIPYKDYPKIKCNYSNTGDKIYHLPFDQQYDRTLIKPNSLDFYAQTVQEAESKGFRHAFRWHS